MRLGLLLLPALLAVATSLPSPLNDGPVGRNYMLLKTIDSKDSSLEDFWNDLRERLRELMVNGSENVPVLDPFYLSHLHLDEEILGVSGAHVTINDMIVRGSSTFVVESASVEVVSLLLQRYLVRVEGYIPILEVDVGNYDLFVHAYDTDVYGNGDAKFVFYKPYVKLAYIIGPRISDGISLYIYECEVRFSLDSIKAEVTGMFNDPELSKEFSEAIEDYLPVALVEYEEEITEILSPIVQNIANRILTGVDPDVLP